MKKSMIGIVLLGAVILAAPGCATKGYVQEQLDPTRARLGDVSKQVEGHDRQLGQVSGEMATTRQSLDETRGRVQTLDGRVGEAGAAAGNAQRSADQALAAARDVDERLTQKWAGRNKYQALETRSVYFDFNKAELRDEGINAIADLAKALQADPNAVVEVTGFTDPRGDDRYNVRLSRDRVDAVIRQLVQKHGIDLRRIHAAGLGKAAAPAGEKATREMMAQSRRVDIKLLAPPA